MEITTSYCCTISASTSDMSRNLVLSKGSAESAFQIFLFCFLCCNENLCTSSNNSLLQFPEKHHDLKQSKHCNFQHLSLMNGTNSSILHSEERFYMLQQGLKCLSFSVTDNMSSELISIVTHCLIKVLMFLYMVILSV